MKLNTKNVQSYVKFIKSGINKDLCTTYNNEYINEFYDLSCFHGMRMIAAQALINAQKSIDTISTEESRKVKSEIYFDIIQRETFLKFAKKCAEKNIFLCPLKGYLLKDLYPKSELRHMGDTDILIKEKDREAVKNIFTQMGFECLKDDADTHDVYENKNNIIFEVHCRFIPLEYKKWCNIDENIWQRCTFQKDFQNVLILSPEDLYTFHLAHAYKHYLYGGFGISTLLDTYVILLKYPNLKNNSKVKSLIKSDYLLDFIPLIEELTDMLFCDRVDELASYPHLFKYIFESGKYGTSKNVMLNTNGKSQNKAINKIKTVFRMLFPTVEIMKNLYPCVEKSLFFLPYAYLHRIFVRCFGNKDKRQTYKNFTKNISYSFIDDEKALKNKLKK